MFSATTATQKTQQKQINYLFIGEETETVKASE